MDFSASLVRIAAIALCMTVAACATVPPAPSVASPGAKPDSETSWAERIAKAVRQNVIFPPEGGAGLSGNPAAEFDVRLAPDGTITGAVLKKSSGVPGWDGAALRGILKTERLPPDVDGRVPSVLTMSMRPFR